MLCAISGESAQEPVASKRSGQVFEKRLIEAYIGEHGKDPVTGEELGLDDLVALQTARVVKPRTPGLTSIPAMLSSFQNEWDAVAVENFTLKQDVARIRQELSTALYNQDAAVRVIARLTQERDHARDAISKVSAGDKGALANGAPPSAEPMQVDKTQLPADIIQKITETKDSLMPTRRKRTMPEGYTTVERVRGMKLFGTTVTTVPAGSRAFEMSKEGDFVLIGGLEGAGAIFSVRKQTNLRVLDMGDSDVLSVVCIDFGGGEKSKFLSAISNAAGKVNLLELDKVKHSFSSHAGPATSVSLHPSGEILASVGEDKSIVLYDVNKLTQVTQVYTNTALKVCEFHPDGALLAAGGANGKVIMFSVLDQAQQAELDVGGPVQAISFSENGIWFAVAVRESTEVQVWDLRKAAVIARLQFGGIVETLQFDWSGQFLAVGGPSAVEVQYYDKAAKQWLSEPALTRAVGITAVRWGPMAKGLAMLQKDGGVNMAK